MKNFVILVICFVLSACGTVGIGSNHIVNIHNNSDSVITATGTNGVMKIQPNTSMAIVSENEISLKSSDKKCDSLIVSRKPNTAAMILDVVPGFVIGIVPILVDAVSNNLYKMPSNYYYQCN